MAVVITYVSLLLVASTAGFHDDVLNTLGLTLNEGGSNEPEPVQSTDPSSHRKLRLMSEAKDIFSKLKSFKESIPGLKGPLDQNSARHVEEGPTAQGADGKNDQQLVQKYPDLHPKDEQGMTLHLQNMQDRTVGYYKWVLRQAKGAAENFQKFQSHLIDLRAQHLDGQIPSPSNDQASSTTTELSGAENIMQDLNQISNSLISQDTHLQPIAADATSFLEVSSATKFVDIILSIVVIVLAIVDAIIALICGIQTVTILRMSSPMSLIEMQGDSGHGGGMMGGEPLPFDQQIDFGGFGAQGLDFSQQGLPNFNDIIDSQIPDFKSVVDAIREDSWIQEESGFMITIPGGAKSEIYTISEKAEKIGFKWWKQLEQIRAETTMDADKFGPMMPSVVGNLHLKGSRLRSKRLRHNQGDGSVEITDPAHPLHKHALPQCKNGYPIGGECQCFPGFTGKTCADVVHCPNNCSTSGLQRMCLFGICMCMPGYTGPECTQVFDCPNFCSRHGSCHFGLCQCEPEWTGEDCSQKVVIVHCLNNCTSKLHGLCLNDGSCLCNSNYTGPDCSKPANYTSIFLELEEPHISSQQSQSFALNNLFTPKHINTYKQRMDKMHMKYHGRCNIESDKSSHTPIILPKKLSKDQHGNGSNGSNGSNASNSSSDGLLDALKKYGVSFLEESTQEATATRFMAGPTKTVVNWLKDIECQHTEDIQDHMDLTPLLLDMGDASEEEFNDDFFAEHESHAMLTDFHSDIQSELMNVVDSVLDEFPELQDTYIGDDGSASLLQAEEGVMAQHKMTLMTQTKGGLGGAIAKCGVDIANLIMASVTALLMMLAVENMWE